jgi:hypothetical protein
VYDALSNMQVEQYIRTQSVAVTANLFVWAELFGAVGLFPAAMRSGGDVFWTKQATERGYKLVYAAGAEVAHPTRRLGALLRKRYRIGAGHHDIRAKERAAGVRRAPTLVGKIRGTLKGFLPAPIAPIRQSLQNRGDIPPVGVWRVWLVAWLCRVASSLGSISRARFWKERMTRAYVRRET